MGIGDPQPLAGEATRLGSYEILRKIARGGMAELFLARTVGPEGFEKLVVLKKILPSFSDNPKFVRLFLDEARLAATLDHPHIAHVYDMGKVEGHYFFTMEYVHGQDMRSTLRRTARVEGRFPIDHTVQIVHAVAAALHYAHERRTADGKLLDIVHRDVSPSNVLISYDGAIKLVDFGVAKAATSSVKTRTGTLKGKIAYMSPEQAKGSPIDRRSDIFSLGIVLWEMITTRRLFKADNDLATIQLIINSQPPPPSSIRPECPPELERIALKALSADLDGRYQTAEELQLDLEELARENKLKQSPIALRAHMHELFAVEIAAWKSAQAEGMNLHDHLTQIGANEMTTPISEAELSFMSEDGEPDLEHDDDEEDSEVEAQEPQQGVLMPTTRLRAQTGTPSQPSMIVAPQQPRYGSEPHYEPPPPRYPTGEQQMVYPQAPAFPIAPREWHATSSPERELAAQQRIQRWVISGLIAVALIVVIILGTAGGNGNARPARAVVDMTPEPVIHEAVVPPPMDAAPAAVPLATPDAALAPPADAAAVAPEPPKHEPPKPDPKPDPKVEPPKPDPKANVKKPKPIEKKSRGSAYDPNSALPPP